MTLHQLQEAILDLVGPPNWREMGITQATLQLQVKELPKLTLHCNVLPQDCADDVQQVTRRYELHEIEDKPPLRAALDLDAMAARAMERVQEGIDESAAHHMEVLAARSRVIYRQAAFDLGEFQHASRMRRWAFLEVQKLAPLIKSMFSDATSGTASFPAGSMFGPATWHLAQGSSLHQHGAALPNLLASLAGAFLLAFVLGAFGPALDAVPDGRSEADAAQRQLREETMAARWEAQARRRCALQGGDNTGYIATANGGIVCTDKRGRLVAQKEVR